MMHYHLFRSVCNCPTRDLAIALSKELFAKKLIFDSKVYQAATMICGRDDVRDEYVLEVLTMRGSIVSVAHLIKERHPEKGVFISSQPEYSSQEDFNTVKRNVVYSTLNKTVFWAGLFIGLLLTGYIVSIFLF